MDAQAQRRTDALSRERIVDAAIELLDAEGESGLTFRALAARLATGPGRDLLARREQERAARRRHRRRRRRARWPTSRRPDAHAAGSDPRRRARRVRRDRCASVGRRAALPRSVARPRRCRSSSASGARSKRSACPAASQFTVGVGAGELHPRRERPECRERRACSSRPRTAPTFSRRCRPGGRSSTPDEYPFTRTVATSCASTTTAPSSSPASTSSSPGSARIGDLGRTGDARTGALYQGRRSAASTSPRREVVGVVTVEQPVGTAARYTAAAEELAASGRWEEAYAHLRAAVRLLHGSPSDELDRLRREHAEARELSHRDSLTASYNRRYLDERLVALLADRWTARACASRWWTPTTSSRSTTPSGTGSGTGSCSGSPPSWARGCPTTRSARGTGARSSRWSCPAAGRRRRCWRARRRASGSPGTPGTSSTRRLRVTVSAGVAHSAGPLTDTERLIGAADVLLYAAKNSGRNAVAYRDEPMGRVHLAGPAGHRRVISQPRLAETLL